MRKGFCIWVLFWCGIAACRAQLPPITPAWAFGHIVWEDNVNTEEGARRIVEGYLERNIPVDAVIIDSPWSTSYNDFTWDRSRYPAPEGLFAWMREKGIRVILWTTGNVNEKSNDTAVQKDDDFDTMRSLNYGVDNSNSYKWWKGEGQHLDFTNPEAVQWWNARLDRAFTEGVYGWKVDQGEEYLGKMVSTSKGMMTKKEFARQYYDSMFDYTVNHNPAGIIIARPYSHQGGFAASVDKLNLGWCGDFSGDWRGLKHQIDNIYRSSQAGYAAVGCEVGGFYGRASDGEQLIRYAQFGAMTACMINGGENGAFTAHLAWSHGEEEESAYAASVSLHEQLRPYLFSTVVDAHLSGGTLIRNFSFEEESHQVGGDLFTKALTASGGHAAFHLPSEGEWTEFWTDRSFSAGSLIDEEFPLNRFPLYVRKGAILPLDNGKGITLMIYPNGRSSRVIHLPMGEGIDYYDCRVQFDAHTGLLIIDSDKETDYTVIIKGKKKDTVKQFRGDKLSSRIKIK